MFYVYEWYIVNTGEIIYVGKGSGRRYKVRKHNAFFNEFIKRYDCESRIVKKFETEKEAFEYEFDRVLELKLKGQCVCNIYSGGFGGTASCWTEEMRDNYSRNNVMKSSEQRKRMSEQNPMKVKEIAQKTNAKKKKKICVGNKIYDGCIDLAREFGVRDSAIQYWIERGYAPNKEPCYYYGDKKPNVILKKAGGNRKAVIVDGLHFNTVKEAAEYCGGWSENIIKAIKNNRPFKGHICRYDNQQPSQTKSNRSSLEGSETNK